MEQLFSNYLSISLENNFNPIVLNTRGVQDLSDESIKQNVDISTASIEELSSIVISDMINSVRKDLDSIVVSHNS